MRRFKYIYGVCAVIFCVLTFNAIKVQAAPIEKRLGGTDRYDTSVKICSDQWSQSDNVILVSGLDFPDALCATPLSKKLNAPILLTDPNTLNDNVLGEIKQLGTKNVYIIGGIGAVSDDVGNTLKGLGINVTRIAGKDRFDTSVEVAKYLGSVTNAVITSGLNYPDALSIASIAGMKQMPILLTDTDTLPSSVQSYLTDNNITQGYIIGGEGAISSNAVSNLTGFKRLAGTNRFTTNAAIIDEFASDLSFATIYIASSDNFPDALSGSACAANNNAPIFLTNGTATVTDPTLLVKLKATTLTKVLGGTGAVSEQGITNLTAKVIYSEIYLYKNYDNTLQYYINRQYTQGANVCFDGSKFTLDKLTYYMTPDNFMYDSQGKYMFLKLNYKDGITVDDLNAMLAGKGVLANEGQAFLTAGKTYNVNPIYLVAHALLETGNGTSKLATGITVTSVDGKAVTPKVVYNMYGIGAVDSDPNKYGSEYAYKKGWFSVEAAIIGGANFISSGYINSSTAQDTLYKMKWDFDTVWHEYATDIAWAYNQTYVIKQLAAKCNNSVFYFEIPIFK